TVCKRPFSELFNVAASRPAKSPRNITVFYAGRRGPSTAKPALDKLGHGLYFAFVLPWRPSHRIPDMTERQRQSRPEPRPGIMDIEAYVPGKSAAPAGGAKIHKLSSNENPLGASPDAIE